MSNVFAEFGAGLTAFSAPLDARLAFIRRTYLHLAAAMGLLVAASAAFFQMNLGERLIGMISGSGMLGVLCFFGAFMALSWISNGLAWSPRSSGLQYVGLAGYTLLQAVFLSPLLMIAVKAFPGAHLLETAAGLTILTFGGLSAYVLTTKKDLTFIGPMLGITFWVLLLAGIAAAFFGPTIGIVYSAAVILFAVGVILYQTSNIVHHFRTDQHVGAALALFSAVILLFVRILVLLMQLQGGGRRRD